MKLIRILLFFSLACGISCSYGQEKNQHISIKNKRKNSEFDLRNYKPESKDKVIIEFNHCGWLNMPKGVKNDWHSRGANLYLYFDYPMGNSNFSFAWGGGIASHNISGNANTIYTIQDNNNDLTTFEPRTLPYKKNIIGAKILEVPIEFRMRTRRARSFKMTLGFKAGYTVQNFRKIFDADGKRKYFDIHNYNPWRYGVVFRIGYEQVYLCGFYSLSEVIQKGKGSSGIIPYTLGIGITPW